MPCREMSANASGKFVDKLPLEKLLFPPEKNENNKTIKLLTARDVSDMR